MHDSEKDLKPDEVRGSFLEGLSRICLALGLGHFLCLPPLYLRFGSYPFAPNYLFYLTTIAVSGGLLVSIAFLCRYTKIRGALSYFCLALLFLQTTFFLSWETTLYQPITMLFPLLCALATPILGRRRASYLTASASSVVLLFFHFIAFKQGLGNLPALTLLHLILYFSAFLSENLWKRIRRREYELEQALNDLRGKTREMEIWVERLGHASSLISTGHVATTLPVPPPSSVFDELTHSMEQMQEKLNHYFTNLFLQDRMNSLGVLASGVAHELNTPLTTMHFLVAGDETIPPETKAALIQEIERMSAIAKSLLSFARPNDKEVRDLSEIVKSSEPLLRQTLKGEIALTMDLSKETLPVRALSNEVQQVLINLFMNATDAMEGISAPVITITTMKQHRGAALLRIEDNGMGISNDNLTKIMNPFFTTKAPGKGTGLGLYIVHQIAQRHGALFSVESQPGRGTKVELIFPLVGAKEEMEAA